MAMTHLEHDNCERVNIGSLAPYFSVFQDLRRSPSGTITPHVKIGYPVHDTWAARLIYNDFWLPRSQNVCKVDFQPITHHTEIAMNHVMRMEVVEAVGDVEQLRGTLARPQGRSGVVPTSLILSVPG